MRLVLEPPPTWPIEGISLEVPPLRASPRDLDKLALTTLLRDVPSTIQLGAPSYSTSPRGWPLRLQSVKLFTKDVEVERRVLAMYQLVDWTGVAMITARDLGAFTTHERILVTMLESGEPDFTDGQASSLWDALSRRPE